MTTVSEIGDPSSRRRVQLMYDYHVPVQPNSEAQLAWQQYFADAVAAWHGLDPEDQEPWNELQREEFRQRGDHPGTYKARSGFNIFISHYLKNL